MGRTFPTSVAAPVLLGTFIRSPGKVPFPSRSTDFKHCSDRQRQHSLLPLLHRYRKPETPVCGSLIPTQRFRTAVQCAKAGIDKDIPHVTPEIVVKYITDLELLGLL
jgi:fatty acid CoA ligase FadD9